jgi:hypothetical protein
LWKIITIFNELCDSYAKYYSPTEYAAVNEIIMLVEGTVIFKLIYQRTTKGFGSNFTYFVILRNIHTIQMCVRPRQ